MQKTKKPEKLKKFHINLKENFRGKNKNKTNFKENENGGKKVDKKWPQIWITQKKNLWQKREKLKKKKQKGVKKG